MKFVRKLHTIHSKCFNFVGYYIQEFTYIFFWKGGQGIFISIFWEIIKHFSFRFLGNYSSNIKKNHIQRFILHSGNVIFGGGTLFEIYIAITHETLFLKFILKSLHAMRFNFIEYYIQGFSYVPFWKKRGRIWGIFIPSLGNISSNILTKIHTQRVYITFRIG